MKFIVKFKNEILVIKLILCKNGSKFGKTTLFDTFWEKKLYTCFSTFRGAPHIFDSFEAVKALLAMQKLRVSDTDLEYLDVKISSRATNMKL